MTSIVADRLCGSIPIMTATGVLLLVHRGFQQGGHRYFEQNRPLSSHSSRGARQDESHERATPTTPAGSRIEGASRRAPGPEPGPAPVLPPVLSSRTERAELLTSVRGSITRHGGVGLQRVDQS